MTLFLSEAPVLLTVLTHDLSSAGMILCHGLSVGMAALQDPDLAGMITKVSDQMGKVMTAVGILGVLLWAIAQLAAPLLPDWAQGLRGYFQKAMVALVVAGFAGTIVTWLYGIGQAS